MKKILIVLVFALCSLTPTLAYEGKSAHYTVTGGFSFPAQTEVAPVPAKPAAPTVTKTPIKPVSKPVTTVKYSAPTPVEIKTETKMVEVEDVDFKNYVKSMLDKLSKEHEELLSLLSECVNSLSLKNAPSIQPNTTTGFMFPIMIVGLSFAFFAIGILLLFLLRTAKK